MAYMMIVSFPLNLTTMVADTKAVCDVVGDEKFIGSGAGFGFRDVEFEFATKEEADEAVVKVLAKFDNYDTSVQEMLPAMEGDA